MLVCLEARLIAPQTIELPGKDRKDLAVTTLWSQPGFVVCGMVAQAKLCTLTVFQREKKRKKQIMNRRSQLPQTKCSFKRGDQTGSGCDTDVRYPILKLLSKMA